MKLYARYYVQVSISNYLRMGIIVFSEESIRGLKIATHISL